MNFTDSLVLDGAPRKTSDGYLVASALVARSGVQIYSGESVGRPDLKEVRLYRPPEQVFDKDSMASFAHKPVTVDHPSEGVNAQNWKALSVGHIDGEVARDGETVRVPLVLMDAGAIAQVEAGKRELSMGYSTDLKWESGQTPDGLKFDAIQTNIRANHVAIVDKARGGPALKIGDDDVPEIKLNKITVDGYSFEVNDAAQTVIEKLQAKLVDTEKKVSDAVAAAAVAATTHATTLAAKDTEIATLKGSILDEKAIDARVAAKDAVIATAQKIIPGLKIEAGTAVADIHKAVVTAKLPEVAKGFKTADEFRVSFDTLAAHAPAASAASGVTALANGLKDMKPAADALSARDEALRKANEETTNAWKGGKAA